ncbi:hypothetical protein ACU6VJ_14970 [Sphaerotilus sulfidivorans]|nr:hypothetical protein CQA4T8M7_21380 [Sphaerotilus natans]
MLGTGVSRAEHHDPDQRQRQPTSAAPFELLDVLEHHDPDQRQPASAAPFELLDVLGTGVSRAEHHDPDQRHRDALPWPPAGHVGELIGILASAAPFEALDMPGTGVSLAEHHDPEQRHRDALPWPPAGHVGELIGILASAGPFEVLATVQPGRAPRHRPPAPAPAGQRRALRPSGGRARDGPGWRWCRSDACVPPGT